MNCIFCDTPNLAKSTEHIVSESFGNKNYVIQKSAVCDECNGRISKSERKALSHSIFVMERARNGIAAKSGKSARGKIGDWEFEGDPDFKKNRISIKGIEQTDLINHNPEKNTYDIIVPSFDKSEDATSKLLLKMALESLFTSQKAIFKKYDFTELKIFLTDKTNLDWPFITCKFPHAEFKSIPKNYDKYLLNKIHCSLLYRELNEETLLFKFKYGTVEMIINLLNRNVKWVPHYLQLGKFPCLFPKYYIKNLPH